MYTYATRAQSLIHCYFNAKLRNSCLNTWGKTFEFLALFCTKERLGISFSTMSEKFFGFRHDRSAASFPCSRKLAFSLQKRTCQYQLLTSNYIFWWHLELISLVLDFRISNINFSVDEVQFTSDIILSWTWSVTYLTIMMHWPDSETSWVISNFTKNIR